MPDPVRSSCRFVLSHVASWRFVVGSCSSADMWRSSTARVRLHLPRVVRFGVGDGSSEAPLSKCG